jgi:hypothetical protein
MINWLYFLFQIKYKTRNCKKWTGALNIRIAQFRRTMNLSSDHLSDIELIKGHIFTTKYFQIILTSSKIPGNKKNKFLTVH